MENLITKKERLISLVFATSALIVSFAPYQLNSTLSLHSSLLLNVLKAILYIFIIINAILVVFPYFSGQKIKVSNLCQMLPIIIYFSFVILYTYNNKFNFVGFLTMFQLITFVLSKDNVKLQTFNYAKKMVFVICILGIICYINYSLKLFIPYQIIAYYGRSLTSKYVDYKVIFLYSELTNGVIRLCGTFNEPGALGTVCALILCADDVNLKDKKNIVILIACVLTFSLASAMLVIIYLILKYSKSIKTILIVLLIIYLYINVLPTIKTGDVNIDTLINRMTITENGISGDDRNHDDLDIIFNYSLKNKPLFGYGDGYLSTKNLKPFSTYKSYIIQYGIIGSLLMWGTLLYSALYKNKKNINVLFFVIVFFASIYQRPHIFNLLYQIILFGGIMHIKNDSI